MEKEVKKENIENASLLTKENTSNDFINNI